MAELIELGNASQAIADSIARYTAEAATPAAQQRAAIAAQQRATNDPGDGVNPLDLNAAALQAYLAAQEAPLQDKRNNVAATAAQKKAAMGGGILPSFDQAYQTSVGGASNKGANTMPEVEQDIRTLRPIQLRAKYGDRQAAALMGQANLANQAVLLDNSTTRSDGQVARDTAVDIASGFVMPALNIGAFGVGLVNDNAGVAASRGLEKLNNFVRNDLQSDELGQRRRLNEARNALDSRDSKYQHEVDLANGDSELVAGLSRFGRGVVNSISNATNDSAILGSGIANGVGSLLSGSVMAKGAAGILPAATKGLAFPTSIGMMEGSSVYQQTVADSYARLIADGVSHDDAVEKATDAGTAAFAMTFPAAVGLSKLVQGFEAAPFAKATMRQSAGNLLREAVEEGSQSGAGRMAQNLATKGYVDPKQDLLDQVGEQAGEGALYGMGTAAAISAPSAAGNAVADTSKYLWGKASGAMADAAAKLESKNEAASPLAPNKVAAEVAATQAVMPETAAVIQAGIDTSSLNQEEKTEGQAYASKLTGALSYGENDLADIAGHPLATVLSGSTGKADAIAKLAALVREGGTSPSDVQVAASYLLHGYVADLTDAIENKPAFLDKLPAEHPAVQSMASIQATLAKVTAQPMVKKILDQVTALAEAENAKAGANLTEQSMATPEGQLAAQNAVNAIAHDPAKANPALVNAVLAHAASGKLVLTGKQQKGVAIAKGLFDTSREDFANRERLGLKTQDIVSNQIQSAEYLAQGQESAVQHATRVYNAYRANDLTAANWHLEDFRKFAESIQNKLAALNEHLNNRQGRKSLNYQTVDQITREWKTSTDPVGITPTNENSVKFMQDVAADAKMLAAVYENLKQTFPELNGQELKAVAVDSRIDKPAAEVVAAFKTDVKPATPNVSNNQPIANTSVEPVQETANTAQVGEESSVDTSTATPEQKKEVRQLLKLIRETTRAEKKAVRENPASLWNALKHSMTEWDLNNIFADWRKNRTFLKGKPGMKLSTVVASGQLDEFLPYDLRFGLVQQVDNGYRAPDPDTAVEFIQQSLVAGDYLTEDTRLLLGQIGTSLQELEQALNVEDLQNALEQVEAELAKQKTNREARRLAKAAATTSQATTGSDPGTSVPQAPQGSVAPAVTPAVEPKKKAEPTATSTPAVGDTGIVVPMNYRDGQDASHVMRSEFKGKSTMDLILSGDRTATTGSLSRFSGLTKGSVFTVENKSTGQKAQVLATTDPYLVSEVTADEWSKLEGWAPSLYAKYKGKTAYQMRYELVNKPAVAEPIDTAVVPPLVQEEEARTESGRTSAELTKQANAVTEAVKLVRDTNEDGGDSLLDLRDKAEELIDLLIDTAPKIKAELRALKEKLKNVHDIGGTEKFKDTARSIAGRAYLIAKDLAKKGGFVDNFVEEEADPIEEEDDSDVTPFVYTGEATGLRDVPEFANLFGGTANRFLDAYKQPAEATSRMALADNILTPPAGAKQSGIEVILRSEDSLEEFMDAAPKVGYTSAVAKAYREYLGQFAGTAVAKLKSNLQDWLAYAPQKGDNAGVTNLQRFLKPGFVNTWENGKILNLLQNNNGKLTYDNKLLEGAVLAGLQWLITSESASSRLKDKDVASIFSIELDEVPAGKAAEMSIGQGETNAVTALASKIQEYWGLESNKDYPLNQVTGITGSMAANILAAFKDIGLLSIETFNWEKPPAVINGKLTRQIKSHNRVIINLADQVNPDSFKALQSYPDAIEQAVMVKPEQTVYLEDERPDVARIQMRNPGAKNKKQALKAIEVNQDTAYKFTHQYKLYEALAANGYDKLMQLFGFGVLTQDDRANKFNKNHLVAVDGKNQSIVSAINGMNYLNEQVKARAEAVGKTPEEVEVHFAHAPSKVQRLQQEGRVTPQGDKNMRAVLSPHEAVLDLDDTRRKDYKNFLIAIAQAVGIKIHNIKPEIVLPQIQKLLDNELKPAVDVLQDWSKNMDRPIQDDAADIFLQSFKDAKMDLSNLALQSLTEYAMYLNAERGKGRTAFPVTLYGEADGITNGPGGAMILHSTGPFTVHQLQMMRKVGYYPGQKGWTAQDQFAVDDVDTYGTVAEILKTSLPALQATYAATSPDAANQAQHMLDLMELLFEGNLSYNDKNELVIKRGAAKSPVTVTIYGAGQRGIASKIAGIIVEELYEKMSAVAAAKYEDSNTDAAVVMFGSQAKYEQFANSWHALTNFYVGFNEKDSKHYLGNTKANVARIDSVNHKLAVNYTVDPLALESLTGNVKRLFVEPMDNAIRETMGESLMNSMTLIRQATQVQTIFLEDAFQTEVKSALAKKEKEDPNFQKGDFLSENELKKILDKLKYMMPKIDNGTQEYYLAGSAAAEVGDVKPFGMSLDGKFKTPAMVYGPKDLGVGGIAALNIGMVDGQMIMNFYWDGEVVGTLPVFDGINLPLDKLGEYSEKANKSIFDAWMGNAMKALSESYGTFMQDTDITAYLRSPQLKDKLAKAFLGQRAKGEDVDSEIIANELEWINRQLKVASVDIETRHLAMQDIGAGIDQMAGFSSPHWHEGTISVEGMTDEQIIEVLNERKAFHRTKVIKDQIKSEDIKDAIFGKDQIQPVEIFTAADLPFLGSRMNIPADQKWMLDELVNNAALDGWTFIAGTKEKIREEAFKHGALTEHLDNLEKGLTLPSQKLILLPTNSSETLVHEMIHAATWNVIYLHYTDMLDGRQSVYAAEAIAKLEELMTQFMHLGENLPALSIETTQQYLHARSVIQGHLDNIPTDGALAKAAALNEFMAYTQTNQALIRLTKNTEINPITPIWKLVIQFMKKLLWGNKAPKIGTDMFSNVLFSTSVLVRYQISPAKTAAAANAALAHTAAAVGNPRLQELRDYFLKKIPDHLTTPVDRNNFGTAAANIDATSVAAQAAITAAQHGFRMDHLENSTFTAIVHSLATQAAIDPNSMARAQELFTLATKKLEITDFIDPTNPDAASAVYYAKEQYELVMGEYSQGIDKLGRSTLLPVFLGLAMVNNHFRDVLSKLELPKSKLKEWNTADNAFENLGKMGLDALSLRLTGEGKHAPNVQAALDALTNHLMDTAQDDLSLAEQTMGKIGTKVGAVNDWVVSNIGKVSGVTTKWAKSVIADSTQGKYKKALAHAAELTAGVVNEDTANGVAEGITSVMNRLDGFKTLREMLSDIIGRTENTAELYDANKVVRSMVSQDRQHYRDGLPEIIRSKFSREVTDPEMTAMFYMAKADIAVLRETMKDVEIRELFTKASALPMTIRAVETQLKTADPKHWNQIEKKAKQLAGFMNGKGAGTNLLRNAEAVSGLFSEKVEPKRVKPDDAFIKAVDKLITLYALDDMNEVHRNNLSSLVQSEAGGVDFVMAYLTGQRAEEMRKAQASPTARENYFKGYVPSEQDGGISLIVANDSEFSKLALKSFTRVEGYKGSSLIGGEPKSYYFAKVPGRAPYNQGTMQNVRQTAGGIDLATGFTDGMMVAGRITDKRLVFKLAQNMANERATNEPLMPIYSNGVVVAFERAVDPLQLERLNQNTDLAKMIGVWRGRQVEEAKVQVFNEALVDAAKRMHKADVQAGRGGEYINVFDPKEQKKDPVLADAVRLLNPETLEYLESVFGVGKFPVRKDMLNDMLGYRNATVGDMWTGNHRWSPETENAVKNIAISVFGNKAYQYAVNNEKLLQNVVSSAKTLIVMKSIVIPMANLIGNMYQLLSRGVPHTAIIRGLPRKTLEIDNYVKSRAREVEAEAELRAAVGNDVATRRLTTELQSIKDNHSRMSIWPLIQAGQFSAISDMGVSRDEVNLTEGKLHDYIEGLVDRLPESVRNMGRYAVITKDTALFRGLQKSVDYGDFIAKAVLFDDLTKRKGMTNAQALARITEEFVNYDKLPGRTRGYLENMGLLWFYNFKLRLVKIALSTIRNNPVHALMVGMAPKPTFFGSIGTPISDNFLTMGVNGELGNSVGLGMALNAPTLNPVINAFY